MTEAGIPWCGGPTGSTTPLGAAPGAARQAARLRGHPGGPAMHVIVDEGIGDRSPLWQQFHAWLGDRAAEIVWLATRYPAMPDAELLDKLLTPDTVLRTRDGVL